MYDIAVIGAGPIGSYIAGELASSGFSVALIEEHAEVGKPVQCAGLITPRTFDITGRRIAVLNSISGARIHAPDGRKIEIDGGREMAAVIDRSLFDRTLAEDAIRNGAELMLGTGVRSIERGDNGKIILNSVKNHSKMEIGSRIVIGADGIQSVTARYAGMIIERRVFSGFEIETPSVITPSNKVDIFIGSEVAPEFFAWIVPTGDGGGRVGLAAPGNAHKYFKNLERHLEWGSYFDGNKAYHYIAGGIHIGPPAKRSYSNGALIVGDAAGQVKATSGGGIYMGLRAAVHAVSAVREALENGDTSTSSLKAYQDRWTADIGKELSTAYRIHRIYASLTDSELNGIFAVLDKKEVLDTIERYGDVDYPSKLVLPLLKAEPHLMKFGGKLLRGL